MNPEKTSKFCRNTLGFYPTPRDSPREWNVFTILNEKVAKWLKSYGVNSGNARDYFHEMIRFSSDEGHSIFEHARNNNAGNMFHSYEACQGFVMTCILNSIAEESAAFYLNKKPYVKPLKDSKPLLPLLYSKPLLPLPTKKSNKRSRNDED